MTITPARLVSSLRWRYATKRFDADRRIPAETWEAIEESLVLTPSSFGLQPWQFLVIGDPEVRAKLALESWGQPQVTEASHYVVLTTRTDLDGEDIDAWIARLCEIQGSTPENLASLKNIIAGYAGSLEPEARQAWNIRQIYIALGQLMATAAMLEIDACPMEGLSNAGYDRVLGLEGSGYATVVACALGYRAGNDRSADRPKARFDRARVIRHL
jgi:nitroreductase